MSQPTARDAMIRFVEAMTNAKVPLHVMLKKLEVRPPRRYRQPIREALQLLIEGVQSALEHRYALDVEQAHGLPPGDRQEPHLVDGRVLFEDVDYSKYGVPLIVRLDGQRYRLAKQVRFRDRRRDNAAELEDRPRLSYGWEGTIGDPCAVFGEVRHVMVRGGWVDTSHSCARCTP